MVPEGWCFEGWRVEQGQMWWLKPTRAEALKLAKVRAASFDGAVSVREVWLGPAIEVDAPEAT
jgi:hypothetical protein